MVDGKEVLHVRFNSLSAIIIKAVQELSEIQARFSVEAQGRIVRLEQRRDEMQSILDQHERDAESNRDALEGWVMQIIGLSDRMDVVDAKSEANKRTLDDTTRTCQMTKRPSGPIPREIPAENPC